MPIKINITLSSGGRFKPVSSRTLAEPKITIGRDDECTLTLEDPLKHVSRVHAELEDEGGTYWMKVVSKVNPVIVNGKRYMFGNRVALTEGDTVTIGLYRLEIQKPDAPQKAPAGEADPDLTYVRPAAPPPPTAAPEADEATFIPPPKAPATPPAPVSKEAEEEEATFVPPVAARPAPGIFVAKQVAQFQQPPENTIPTEPASEAAPGLDFDLSEEETYVPRPADAAVSPAQPAPVPAAPPAREAEEFNDEATMIRRPAPPAPPAPAAPPKPAEEEFNDEATMIRRPAPPAPAAPAAPPKPAEEEFNDEATMIRRPAPPAPAAPAAPPKREEEEFNDEMTMIRRPAPPAAAPAPVSAPIGTGGEQLVQAFLQGAGLSQLKISDPQAFMRDSGTMVRAAVEGVMMLLLAREEARKELGAGASDQEGGDNPLKSMASPAEVIAFLFDPQRPAIGDSDPIQALGDACADLRAHQVALLAGMKAAIAGALGSLDPRKIEREHGKSLGGLNLTRKSKLWDISVAQHEKLAREMEEDFGAVFGREILAAYTAQVRKLRGGR
ncbi:MAG: FHA domain-containing protein [Proteobacteria bacterium]|nr:FHA domain-containing protein [Pseudomonadota bacterium]